jgi:hypothetical protein
MKNILKFTALTMFLGAGLFASTIEEILGDEDQFNQVAITAFQSVDLDANGQIDSTELGNCMKSIFPTTLV